MSRKFASLFAAIAIAAASVAPAFAEPATRAVSVAVSYADLDLSRVEGIKTLTLRLKRAVDVVCGRSRNTASMAVERQIKSCRTTAMNNALASIDLPVLTAAIQGGEGTRFAGL